MKGSSPQDVADRDSRYRIEPLPPLVSCSYPLELSDAVRMQHPVSVVVEEEMFWLHGSKCRRIDSVRPVSSLPSSHLNTRRQWFDANALPSYLPLRLREQLSLS